MTEDKGILIKNIYYMLAYAFQVLKQTNYEEIEGDCAKAPRVISREEPLPLDKENCEVCT